MREFIDSIEAPVDAQFSAAYLALPIAERTQARNIECPVVIDALAKGCFLMGVNQAIRVTQQPAMLTKAIQEAMSLKLINESNGAQGKISSLAKLEDEDLAKIAEDLDNLTIKMINNRRAKFGRQPFKQGNRFQSGKP
jgi:hypothetical protein